MNRIKYLIYRIKYRFSSGRKIRYWNRVLSREERAALMDEMKIKYEITDNG